MRVLVTADRIQDLQLEMDTSILLCTALLDAGFSVDWCELADLDVDNALYLQELRVKSIVKIKKDGDFLVPEFGEVSETRATDYNVILHRKDPPVDEFYLAHHEKFVDLPSKVIQINHPKVTVKHSEHELPILFPEFAIPTATIHTFDELQALAKKLDYRVVIKPHNSCSGRGILFAFSEAELEKHRDQIEAAFPWVAQPFIADIENLGDLRVLYFNGKHLGQILRLPKKGSLLANIHQGGRVVTAELSPRQKVASKIVADTLLKMGVYLIGIDFLGDQISEVNITSPMGFREVNRLYNKESHQDFVRELKKLLPFN